MCVRSLHFYTMLTTNRWNTRSLISFGVVLAVHILIGTLLHSRLPAANRFVERVSTIWLLPTAPQLPPPRPRHVAPSPPQSVAITTSRMTLAPHADDRADKSAVPTAEQPAPDVSPVHLDLDALRNQAVQQEMTRKKSVIELMNEGRQKDTSFEAKVEDRINQSQRADCRTAYAGIGPLALIGIAADLMRDKGCKF